MDEFLSPASGFYKFRLVLFENQNALRYVREREEFEVLDELRWRRGVVCRERPVQLRLPEFRLQAEWRFVSPPDKAVTVWIEKGAHIFDVHGPKHVRTAERSGGEQRAYAVDYLNAGRLRFFNANICGFCSSWFSPYRQQPENTQNPWQNRERQKQHPIRSNTEHEVLFFQGGRHPDVFEAAFR